MAMISAKDLYAEGESALKLLTKTLEILGEAVRRAHCDSDDFTSGGLNGEAVSGSREADRATAGKALGQWKGSADQKAALQYAPDPVRGAATQMADNLYAANHAAHLAFLSAHQLIRLDPKKVAMELGDTPSSCICCGRDVWNTVSDRRRAERCYACWDWWRDHANTNCSKEVHDRRDERRSKQPATTPADSATA